MSVRDEVLSALEKNRGAYVSGGELAKVVGVSRTAVWKAVRALEDDGFKIDAKSKLGYRLAQSEESLSKQGIQKYLNTGFYDICEYRSVTSTNAVAKEAAANGAPEGTVIAAHTQSAGRGRLNRAFASPDRCGVYFSVIFRPKAETKRAVMLTVMAAVAVAEGIEEIGGAPTEIKWVNDVLTGGKKCCGILTEATTDLESGGIEYAVVGIGIDVKTPAQGYGPLEGVAAAACDGVEDALNKTVAAVLNKLEELYAAFDIDDICARYKRKSCVIGRDIYVLEGNMKIPATAVDIDENCRLCVRYADGQEEVLSAGEVSIRW